MDSKLVIIVLWMCLIVAECELTNWPDEHLSAFVGQNVTLPCRTDLPLPVFWYLNEHHEIFYGGSVSMKFAHMFKVESSMAGDYNLVILNANKSNSGIYTCGDDEGDGEKRSTNLTVTEMPDVSTEPGFDSTGTVIAILATVAIVCLLVLSVLLFLKFRKTGTRNRVLSREALDVTDTNRNKRNPAVPPKSVQANNDDVETQERESDPFISPQAQSTDYSNDTNINKRRPAVLPKPVPANNDAVQTQRPVQCTDNLQMRLTTGEGESVPFISPQTQSPNDNNDTKTKKRRPEVPPKPVQTNNDDVETREREDNLRIYSKTQSREDNMDKKMDIPKPALFPKPLKPNEGEREDSHGISLEIESKKDITYTDMDIRPTVLSKSLKANEDECEMKAAGQRNGQDEIDVNRSSADQSTDDQNDEKKDDTSFCSNIQNQEENKATKGKLSKPALPRKPAITEKNESET